MRKSVCYSFLLVLGWSAFSTATSVNNASSEAVPTASPVNNASSEAVSTASTVNNTTSEAVPTASPDNNTTSEDDATTTYTKDDVNWFLTITDQDESIYFTIIAADVADYDAGLSYRIIDAYQVSQKAGNCSLLIKYSAVDEIRSSANQTKSGMSEVFVGVREAFAKAKTQEEIHKAVTTFGQGRITNSKLVTKFVEDASKLFIAAIGDIKKCLKNNA